MPLRLTEKQKEGLQILDDPEKTRVLFTGGSRSGKTVLICEYLVRRVYQFPGSRQLLARRALVDIRNSIWNDTLLKYLKSNIPDSEYDMRQSELRVIFKNGSELQLGGLDDEERMQKILGTEFLTIFCNEATEMKYTAVQMLITRLAQKVWDSKNKFVGVNKLILDCNPTISRHWLNIWGCMGKDPSQKPPQALKDADKHAMLHWTAYDNKENLPDGYLDQLDALPSEMRERMLLGNWVGGEGLIFKEFKEDVNLCEPFPIPRSWARYRAIDFGYNHPFACIRAAYDFATDTIFVYAERKEQGLTIDEISDLLNKDQMQGNEFYERTWADHDKSDRAFLAKNGIYTSPARKSVLDGINSIRQRLIVNKKTGRPRLVIFNTLYKLIDEIYSYVWHESNSEVQDKDSPVKLNDDEVDTLRYICYGIDKSTGGIF